MGLFNIENPSQSEFMSTPKIILKINCLVYINHHLMNMDDILCYARIIAESAYVKCQTPR